MPGRRALRVSLSLLLSSSLLVVVVAAWAPLSGCLHAECNAICESSFGVNAHVPVTAAALAGGSVTLCRDGACESASFGGASDAGVVGDTALSGDAFSARVQVNDEDDGYSVVGISLDLSHLTLSDGDVYSVKVVDAQGAALLSVSRPITYDSVQSCGVTCTVFTMDVYPTSASGITCGDKSCVSGVELTGTMATSDAADAVVVSFCRNGGCGTASLSLAPIVGKSVGEQQEANLEGFGGEVVIVSKTSRTFSFEVARSDDGAVLEDGDACTLTIEQGSNALVSWSSAVTYQTTYPNGARCDAVPCRYASVSVP